jgi:DNA-binding NarL/FixJ family response regulator
MKALVLDDQALRHDGIDKAIMARDPNAGVWHVYTTAQAIKTLSEIRFDEVYLDYDLCDKVDTGYFSTQREATGYDVAWHIARQLSPDQWPKVIIHSMNAAGGNAMQKFLEDAGVRVVRLGFNDIMKEVGV